MEFLEYEGDVEGVEESGRVEGGAEPLPHALDALASSPPPRGGASGGPGFASGAGAAGRSAGDGAAAGRQVVARRRVARTVKASEVSARDAHARSSGC